MHKSLNSINISTRHLLLITGTIIISAVLVFTYFKFTKSRIGIQAGIEKITNPLNYLQAGNNRFVEGVSRHPDESPSYRHLVAKAQHPFAIVVTCSDSRLSPELIFDQGLGDLFVIRTAGNIITDIEMASIEYAVEHLGVKLIAVMGHEHCGAVEALFEGKPLHGHMHSISDSLNAEQEIQDALKHHDLTEAVKANVIHQVHAIETDSLIVALRNNIPVKITGMYYSLETGLVTKVIAN